nr:DUF3309 family protein [Fuscovulum blasticum]
MPLKLPVARIATGKARGRDARAEAPFHSFRRKPAPMLTNILIIILVLMLVGALPNWRYSASWGYLPSGGLGIILVILLVLVLTGRI